MPMQEAGIQSQKHPENFNLLKLRHCLLLKSRFQHSAFFEKCISVEFHCIINVALPDNDCILMKIRLGGYF